MTIYLDVIWFLNFCIDLLLLCLTAIVLKRSMNKWRLILGALMASSIVLALFTPLSTIVYHPLIKTLFSMLIVLFTFGYKRFSYFAQNLCMFYFVSFICGGGIFALHYFLQNDATVLNGIVATKSSGFGSPISWSLIVLGFPAVWYFSKKNIQQVEVQQVKYDQIVDVVISIDQTEIKVKGLIDSGNQLHDPITKAPVMILDVSKMVEYIPDWLVEASKKIDEIGTNLGSAEERDKWQERMRIIPYRGVGQENQFLIGIKPDQVKVTHDNEVYGIAKVLIGLSHTVLSAEDEYECIIHPKMITNGIKQMPA
ncbi:sigma-E processing peptidase SpoIIGA [Anaerobacillus sp. MEB173]|uniref:sigma-E processing peptidase SpoIIGA n=1 Tax=Anaerobacillus sp. MEB173 TaxID=3383345 RepID=UPI003F8F16F7